jgi:hypothetical protein
MEKNLIYENDLNDSVSENLLDETIKSINDPSEPELTESQKEEENSRVFMSGNKSRQNFNIRYSNLENQNELKQSNNTSINSTLQNSSFVQKSLGTSLNQKKFEERKQKEKEEKQKSILQLAKNIDPTNKMYKKEEFEAWDLKDTQNNPNQNSSKKLKKAKSTNTLTKPDNKGKKSIPSLKTKKPVNKNIRSKDSFSFKEPLNNLLSSHKKICVKEVQKKVRSSVDEDNLLTFLNLDESKHFTPKKKSRKNYTGNLRTPSNNVQIVSPLSSSNKKRKLSSYSVNKSPNIDIKSNVTITKYENNQFSVRNSLNSSLVVLSQTFPNMLPHSTDLVSKFELKLKGKLN